MTFPCFEIMFEGIKANLEIKKSMTEWVMPEFHARKSWRKNFFARLTGVQGKHPLSSRFGAPADKTIQPEAQNS